MRRAVLAIFLAALFLLGCAKSPEPVTKSVLVTLRTQNVAFHETAFLVRQNQNRFVLQIYVAGQAAYVIRAGTMICVQDRCMDRREFNTRHLSHYYPETLLIDVLSGRAIRGLGGEIERHPEGFVQAHTLKDRYAIRYEKSAQGVRFVDSHNRIVIAIKAL